MFETEGMIPLDLIKYFLNRLSLASISLLFGGFKHHNNYTTNKWRKFTIK